MRDYLHRTFPLLYVRDCTLPFTRGFATRTKRPVFHFRDPSVNRTNVAESAVVLHWQGTDSSLKPVLITNNDGMSGVSVQVLGL